MGVSVGPSVCLKPGSLAGLGFCIVLPDSLSGHTMQNPIEKKVLRHHVSSLVPCPGKIFTILLPFCPQSDAASAAKLAPSLLLRRPTPFKHLTFRRRTCHAGSLVSGRSDSRMCQQTSAYGCIPCVFSTWYLDRVSDKPAPTGAFHVCFHLVP